MLHAERLFQKSFLNREILRRTEKSPVFSMLAKFFTALSSLAGGDYQGAVDDLDDFLVLIKKLIR